MVLLCFSETNFSATGFYIFLSRIFFCLFILLLNPVTDIFNVYASKFFTIFFGAYVSGSIHVIMTGLSPVLALQDDSLVSCLPLLNNLLGTYKHHEVQIKRISENVPRNSLFPSLIP